MIFHASLSLVKVNTSVAYPTFSHLVSPFNIFLAVFPSCIFPSIIPVAQDVLVSLFSSHGLKKVAWGLCILFILLCHLLVTLFRLSSLLSMRFILCRNHISVISSLFFNYFETDKGPLLYIRLGSL